MKNVLITGANRGIGLEFVRQFIAKGWRVYACCRNPAKAAKLNQLALISGMTVHTLDVEDPESIAALARTMSAQPLDLLINNAGVYGHRGDFGAIDYQEWHRVLDVNAMGPLRVTQALVGNLEKGEDKKLICITSQMGSISDNTSGGSYLYRSSKAALNMVAKSLAHDLAPRGIVTAVLHPGWVQTDMGGPNALISTETSVKGMIGVILNLDKTGNGSFLNYNGKNIGW